MSDTEAATTPIHVHNGIRPLGRNGTPRSGFLRYPGYRTMKRLQSMYCTLFSWAVRSSCVVDPGWLAVTRFRCHRHVTRQ